MFRSLYFTPFLIIFAVASALLSFAADSGKPDESRPDWAFPEGEFAELFPFKIEKGAPENITNVQTWGAPWQDAGTGPVLSIHDSAFFKGDAPFYFMGTNTCFGANFCDKESAERLAATLARFGVRVVRLHHMDSRDIWGKNFERTKTEIDPEQLDRLDYLIAQFEKRGVYVNINLHVSRYLDERDGFENSDGYHRQCKGVDNFEPRMIALQKDYARDLLTHVNPYTGRAYTDDPGVAMIEINNENSVVACWTWGEMDKLGEPYSALFQSLWNDWLVKKYGNTDALRKAWNCRVEPLTDDQVDSKAFSAELDRKSVGGWTVQTDGQSLQTVTIRTAAEANLPNPLTPESNVLKIAVEKNGSAVWIPQVHRVGIKLEKGALYTWSFKIRANKESRISGSVRMNHEPWHGGPCDRSIEMTPEWKEFVFEFVATTDDDNMRIGFSSLTPGLEIELADVSLRRGGRFGLAESETLEAKSVPVLCRYKKGLFVSDQTRRDFAAFLLELEGGYWDEMYRYVKEELKAKPPVSGTQLGYGGSYAQAALDYCDLHSYWQHPDFPSRSWDGNDWYVNSGALVNSSKGGTLTSLAALRVISRAQTVSEYDHPYPNLYCAEGNLMIAAFGAFQNWTGVNQFAWSHGSNFDPEAQTTFFDLCGNQAKMAHLPACFAMIQRGDVRRGPGKFAAVGDLTRDGELELIAKKMQGWANVGDVTGVDASLAMAVYGGTNLIDRDGPAKLPAGVQPVKAWSDLPEAFGSPEKNRVTNEFGELTWNFEQEGAGYFTVDTPGVKVLTGFVRGRSFELGGVRLAPGQTRLDWTSVSITAARAESPETLERDGKKLLAPGRYLIAATGMVQNTGAKFVEYAEGQITTAKKYGGSPGWEPVLCEGVPLDVTLDGYAPERVAVWALDAAGDRGEKIPVAAEETGCRFHLGPESKTLWYELEIQ